MTIPWNQRVKEAVEFLKQEVGTPPSIVVILSGGLQSFIEALKETQTVEASAVPHFPRSGVEGHKGQLVFGNYAGQRLAVVLGRAHYYEGLAMQEIALPLHSLHVFGAKTLFITNAAGGINPSFEPGDLMAIRDHINCMGDNPLRGFASQSKQQFVDMTNAYPSSLRQVALTVGQEANIELHEGVYLATTGPSYETPAEIRVFRNMGADAVGMSTVPEVIVANYHRMHVLGVSCITNLAADLHPGGMNHAEVLRSVKTAEPKLMELLLGTVDRLAKSGAGSGHGGSGAGSTP